MKNLSSVFWVFWLAVASTSCGQADWAKGIFGGKDHGALVKSVDVHAADAPAVFDPANASRFAAADALSSAVGAGAATTAVSGSVTYRKSRLFDRDFLYGFDLQYSSGSDATLELIPQSQSVGHIPAFFRRMGNELQLVADQRRLYESVVNHPEVLLATYRIINETDDELTVAFETGGLVMNQILNGPASNDPTTPMPDAPTQVWLRSIQYVEDGDYLLQETGLMLKNGQIQTFMESIFPRANLVPQGYVGMEGAAQYEPLAARYRFLTGEKVFTEKKAPDSGATVRLPTTYTSRFDLEESGNLDWYVTPNITDEFLPVIKSGVEGWNRYFRLDLGRDVMHFKGRLPDGVKLGDPRYNIINFDSVAQAGAAYESQAIDPMTGIQSHSLIYMPLAWYNIGADVWKLRTDSTKMPSAERLRDLISPKAPDAVFGPGHRVIACVQSAADIGVPASVIAEAIKGGNVSVPASIDEFSKRLMISTLFHEVGHSLGFDHQFKGSLAFDGAKPAGSDNPTTYSVMDYNYYQNEQDLFTTIGGSDGPLLEYDRQVISELYHHGQDVKDTDKVIAACNDAEADNTVGGVDPLCNRYDNENDPSMSALHIWNNFIADTGAAGPEAHTLTEMLVALTPYVTTHFSSTTDIPTAAAALTAATDLGNKVGSLVSYYLATSHQSVRDSLIKNPKALRVWQDGVPLDEAAFRGRYTTVLKGALALSGLPEKPQGAVDALTQALQTALQANPSVGAAAADRSAAASKAAAAFTAALGAKNAADLTLLRTDVYKSLAFDLTSPFALVVAPGGDLSHYEDLVSGILADGVLRGLGEGGKAVVDLQPERKVAATTLLTFKSISSVPADVTTKLTSLVAKGQQTGDVKLVTAARELLKVLGG